MKSLIAIIGITFSYVFFKISPFFVFATLTLLSASLVWWMLVKIKMLPQFQIDIPPFFSKKLQEIDDTLDHVSKSKQAMADKDFGDEPAVVEHITVVSPQELRRLESEAAKAEAQRLREREDIKKELLNEIENEQKERHEIDYFNEHGISIEDNLIALENLKNEMVNVVAKKVARPQLDPNARND